MSKRRRGENGPIGLVLILAAIAINACTRSSVRRKRPEKLVPRTRERSQERTPSEWEKSTYTHQLDRVGVVTHYDVEEEPCPGRPGDG